MKYLPLIKHYLKLQWPRFSLLFALIVISDALILLNPQILKYFIDSATSGEPTKTLILMGLLFIALALVYQLISIAVTYVGDNVGWLTTNALRLDLLEHCLRLDMSFHKSRTPGELIERIDGDVNALSGFFTQFFVVFISNIILFVGIIVLLFRESWLMGTALAVFSVIAFAVLDRIRKLATPYWEKVRQVSADFYGFIVEHFSAVEDIRANGAVKFVMHRFYQLLRLWLPLNIRANAAGTATVVTTLTVLGLSNGVMFGVSAYLWQAGAMSIGSIYLAFHYSDLLVRPIEQFRGQLEQLQRAAASLRRVTELFAMESKIVDGPGQLLPAGPLSVSFQNVSFKYQDEKVLNDISLELSPNEVLGVAGRTGSGKSTLARLLLRFYDPEQGEIFASGRNLRELKVEQLRSRIGIVTQDVQLFHATVRQNVTLFKNIASDHEIIEVLYDLGLGYWYETLPAGLDTELNAAGGLSAGEAQLLAFARVFLANPGLVILDEATSRLDPASEKLIELAMQKLFQGRTGIIIAHRLATLQRVDKVLILENGAIVEQGERNILAANISSRFYQLLQKGSAEVVS
jgi:ATP-binding cassette subfamily B protein